MRRDRQTAARSNHGRSQRRCQVRHGAAGSERIRVAVSGNGAGTFASNGPFGDAIAQQQVPLLVHQGARLIFGWLESRGGTVGLFTNRVQ